jgi:5-(carboxyamino)imidazole ribonucleotide synthase
MAPATAQLGHYSIDACDVSQFDLQVRALAAQPLVAPRPALGLRDAELLGDLCDGGAARPTGPACSRCPACTCTCTARPSARRAARWAT